MDSAWKTIYHLSWETRQRWAFRTALVDRREFFTGAQVAKMFMRGRKPMVQETSDYCLSKIWVLL